MIKLLDWWLSHVSVPKATVYSDASTDEPAPAARPAPAFGMINAAYHPPPRAAGPAPVQEQASKDSNQP